LFVWFFFVCDHFVCLAFFLHPSLRFLDLIVVLVKRCVEMAIYGGFLFFFFFCKISISSFFYHSFCFLQQTMPPVKGPTLSKDERSSLLLTTQQASCLVIARKYSEKNGLPPTHLFMDGTIGGKLYLPSGEEQAFLDAYASDIQKAAHLFISEQRTEVFKMHFDIDHITLNEVEQLHLLKFIQGVIKAYYPSLPQSPLLFVADTSKAEESYGWMPRRDTTNLHIYAPDILVNSARATLIADTCIAKLLKSLPRVNWDNVIDLAIYGPNGLRMIGSRKIGKKCKECVQDPTSKTRCAICSGLDKYDAGRAYAVTKVLNECGEYDATLLAHYANTMVSQVKICSIRCAKEQPMTPGFTLWQGPGIAHSGTIEEGAAQTAFENDEHITNNNIPRTPNKTKSRAQEIKYDALSLQFAKCQEEVNAFDASYSGAVVGKVSSNLNGSCYMVNLHTKSEGRRRCFNLPNDHNGGYHSNASVYFIISPNGIMQRCFSTNPQAHLNGTCKQFRSEPKLLSKSAKAILFPSQVGFGAKHSCFVSQAYATKMKILDFMERGGKPKPKKRTKRKADS
jgi:hypothetical protein